MSMNMSIEVGRCAPTSVEIASAQRGILHDTSDEFPLTLTPPQQLTPIRESTPTGRVTPPFQTSPSTANPNPLPPLQSSPRTLELDGAGDSLQTSPSLSSGPPRNAQEGDNTTASLRGASNGAPEQELRPLLVSQMPEANLQGALKSLSPRRWLSSTAIELVLKLLPSSQIFVFDPSYFSLSQPRQIEISKSSAPARQLLIPIHDRSSSHWTLAILDRDARVVEYYDSLPGNSDNAARDSILESIRLDDSAAPWGFLRKSTPVQLNGWDCGVHVLVVAFLRLTRSAPDEVPSSMDSSLWRQVFRDMLCKGSTPDIIARNIRANTDAKTDTEEPRPDIEIDGSNESAAPHGGLASADMNKAEYSHQIDVALESISTKRTRSEKVKALVENRKMAIMLFKLELEKLQLDLQHAVDEHDPVCRDLHRIDSMMEQCNELEVSSANGVKKPLEDLHLNATIAVRTRKSDISMLEQRVKAFAAGEQTCQVALDVAYQDMAEAEQAVQSAIKGRRALKKSLRVQREAMECLERRLASDDE